MKLVTLALVAASSVAVFANGNMATANAEVGVKIVAPICIVNPDQSKLDFGTVTVSDPTLGITVVHLTDGTTGYKNCDPYSNTTIGGTAWFHIRKDHDLTWANVNVSVPPTVDLGSGVTVSTQTSPWEQCSTLNGQPTFLSNTTYDDLRHFWVGGTLTAPANTFGTFSATMTVTANYQ